MSEPVFDTPVFIKALQEAKVDTAQTPFFYNDGGWPTFLSTLPEDLVPLTPSPTDPTLAAGNEYRVVRRMGGKATPPYGVQTQLAFAAEQVVYAPLWATPDIAAAFGITLVEPGQAVAISSPVVVLQQIEYEYGVFAGHWSPYQDTGNQLLSVVCTDLEHHDFPHVFASTDPTQPLVISVGRYWPERDRICLADLWVPRGSALYIPPKPALAGQTCIDLHNNRNSARACWGDIRQGSIVTHTLLQNEGGYFYWYWNPVPTVHERPADLA